MKTIGPNSLRAHTAEECREIDAWLLECGIPAMATDGIQYYLIGVSADATEALYEYRNQRMGGRSYLKRVVATGEERQWHTVSGSGKWIARRPASGRWRRVNRDWL